MQLLSISLTSKEQDPGTFQNNLVALFDSYRKNNKIWELFRIMQFLSLSLTLLEKEWNPGTLQNNLASLVDSNRKNNKIRKLFKINKKNLSIFDCCRRKNEIQELYRKKRSFIHLGFLQQSRTFQNNVVFISLFDSLAERTKSRNFSE